MNDGALRLLFQDVAGGRVRDAVSSDAGGTWVFREVSDGDAETASFDLTADASNQTLTHVAYAGSGLVYARAAGSATTWTRTTLDAAPGAGATGIAVATRATTVAVLYRKDGTLWLIRSTDNGTTWGTATRVADAAAGLLALEIDVPGALHALYPLPDGSGPVHALSADGGTTWVETTISDKTDLSGSRQLMVFDGELLVVAFGSGSGVHVARSSDAGATWTIQKLSDGTGASLVLDRSGTLHLACRGEDGKSVKILNSVDAHSWNRETIESAPGSDPRDVVIAVSGDAVFVPFVQFEADLVAAWNGGLRRRSRRSTSPGTRASPTRNSARGSRVSGTTRSATTGTSATRTTTATAASWLPRTSRSRASRRSARRRSTRTRGFRSPACGSRSA